MISVIVPVYQEGEAILDFLTDLIQAHEVEECIVVDASGAEQIQSLMPKIAAKFDRNKIVYVAADAKGRANQMNQGASIRRSPNLLFLHADTLLPAGALDKIQAGMEAGWHWGRFDVSFNNPRWPFRMIAAMMNWRSRKTGIATGDQAIFMRGEVFDRVGGYDAIPLMEDIAMSAKLRHIGAPLCLDARVQTDARRWEENGILKTILLMWFLRFTYWLGVSPTVLANWYR